jgi:uncharacterized protein (TIGR02145 family)
MLTVKIGNQEWSLENLDVSEFKNGDSIPEAKTAYEWVMAADRKQPAWCYYTGEDQDGEVYGRLYNGYCVYDERCLAPDGYRIPNTNDWNTLTTFLGYEVAARRMLPAELLQLHYPGTEASGFSAFLGGWRSNSGIFEYKGEMGFWWILDNMSDQDHANVRSIHYMKSDISEAVVSKAFGFNVRCLRDT